MAEFKYLMYDHLSQIEIYNPIGSELQLNGLSKGTKVKRIEHIAISDKSYPKCYIIYDQEPPNHQWPNCCKAMIGQINMFCEQHGTLCPDKVVCLTYNQNKVILLAENAQYELNYCPWCGKKVVR